MATVRAAEALRLVPERARGALLTVLPVTDHTDHQQAAF